MVLWWLTVISHLSINQMFSSLWSLILRDRIRILVPHYVFHNILWSSHLVLSFNAPVQLCLSILPKTYDLVSFLFLWENILTKMKAEKGLTQHAILGFSTAWREVTAAGASHIQFVYAQHNFSMQYSSGFPELHCIHVDFISQWDGQYHTKLQMKTQDTERYNKLSGVSAWKWQSWIMK